LPGRRAAGVPHEIIGDEQPASLERVEQWHLPALADERRRAVDRDHREPPAGGRDRVALARMSLLPDPHRVQLFLEGRPIDYLGRTKLVSHHFVHGFLRSLLAQVRDMRSTGGLRGLKHDFMLAKHSYGCRRGLSPKG